MKILILGGDGMLGHQLLLSYRDRHETNVTLRNALSSYAGHGLFDTTNCYDLVDVCNLGRLEEVIKDFKPDAVINAVGIVKQRQEADDAIISIEVNALLPHRLAVLCRQQGARLLHMSTDCVFSGDKGNYREEDFADAHDLYGRSKFLGEVHSEGCITLRTSIIGLELARNKSLVEWFLAQQDKIKGYTCAIYSGLTTQEMARIIEFLLVSRPQMSGLWHVASEPINKYDLLRMLADKIGRTDIVIEPDDEFECDRSLDGSLFRQETSYTSPAWDELLDELAGQVKARETT